MVTEERAGACIYAMLATIKEANQASSAPLDDVEALVNALLIKFQSNPATVGENEIFDTATMLWGFLSPSFTNIRRFFRDLDPESTASLDAPLADGSHLADGSVSAA
jgi:hypothetical protein